MGGINLRSSINNGSWTAIIRNIAISDTLFTASFSANEDISGGTTLAPPTYTHDEQKSGNCSVILASYPNAQIEFDEDVNYVVKHRVVPLSGLTATPTTFTSDWYTEKHTDNKLHVSAAYNLQFVAEPTPPEPDCAENSDCAPNEKCVDGECVPCDNLTALSGTLSLVYLNQYNQIVADKQSEDFSIQTGSRLRLGGGVRLMAVRIANDEGFPEGSLNLVLTWRNAITQGFSTTALGVLSVQAGATSATLECSSWLNSLVPPEVVESIDWSSNFGADGDCNENPSPPQTDDGYIAEQPPYTGTQPPPPPPPPPDDGEPIDTTPFDYLPHAGTGGNIIGGSGGGVPPAEPESGCECEIYAANTLLAGLQQIRNTLVDHGNALDKRFLDLTTMLDTRLMSIEAVLGSRLDIHNQNMYNLMTLVAGILDDQLRDHNENLDDLVAKFKLPPLEPEYPDGQTITEVIKEFADNYEPVQIENEYRTQSHRVIDNLDSTLEKL